MSTNRLTLIPCGATEWHAEERWLGRVELTLTQAGQREVQGYAEQLRGRKLARLLHGPDALAVESAQMLGRLLRAPTRVVEELAEVDLGLWTGLTATQVEARFETAWREMRDAPLNVTPPAGESFRLGQERLAAAVAKVRRRFRAEIGLLLRPIAFELVHASLAGRAAEMLVEAATAAQRRVVIMGGQTSEALPG